MDNRLLEFIVGDKVKIEFQGLPDNTLWGRPDTTEYKYHAVEEISVQGS